MLRMNKISLLCLLLGFLVVQIVALPQAAKSPDSKNNSTATQPPPPKRGDTGPENSDLPSETEFQKCLTETSGMLCKIKKEKESWIAGILKQELDNLNVTSQTVADPKGFSMAVSGKQFCNICLQRANQSNFYAIAIAGIGLKKCADEYFIDFNTISNPSYKSGREILLAIGHIVLDCCNTSYITNCDGKNLTCVQACKDVHSQIQCSIEDLESSFRSCIQCTKTELRNRLTEIREELDECTVLSEERDHCLETYQAYDRPPCEEKIRQYRSGDCQSDCQCYQCRQPGYRTERIRSSDRNPSGSCRSHLIV